MRKITADYIFPISLAPVKNGVITLSEEGTVIDIEPPSIQATENAEYHEGIICPGFVNAHCHLELSHLKGKIPKHTGLPGFIKHLQQARKVDFEEIQQAIVIAENEMIANGIVAVGDICNGHNTFLQKSLQRLKYHTFIEVFGFDPLLAEGIMEKAVESCKAYKKMVPSPSISITLHAPYSVSTTLLEDISSKMTVNTLLSLHNQESIEENLFFLKKEGAFVDMLQSFGISLENWKPTRLTSLFSVAKQLPKTSKVLLVHNIYTAQEEIRWMQNHFPFVYWCFCPNANLYIENKLPFISLFIEENVKITIGTDSLASNEKLSILEELKTIASNYPDISLQTLLSWATLNGATFFGFEQQLGSIEKGKKPGLNLITNINNLKLTSESEVIPIVSGKL